MTRRLLTLTTVTLAAATLAPAATAHGAKPLPVIAKVEPMRLGIGDTMTITGKNFRKGALVNTVVFKRKGKRAIFVKVGTATSTQLTFTLPEKLRAGLAKGSAGALVPTKFQINVLTYRFGKRYTTMAESPVVAALATQGTGAGGATTKPAPAPVNAAGAPPAAAAAPTSASAPPANCDGDALVDDADGDDDNDGLPDGFEAIIQTNRCAADTDADGMWDMWEYESALALNGGAGGVPYPGKRPYPNPLDGSDLNTDFDGDGLEAWREHLLWERFGARALPLNYSDGDQTTVNGQPSDDLRDADGDGMGNFYEATGPLSSPDWWTKRYNAEKPYPVPYKGTDFADADVDGDRILDGADDIDHDGYTNLQEASRLGSGIWLQPFNPCLPNPNSSFCRRHVPLEGDVWPPFDRAPFKMDDSWAPFQYCVPLAYPFVWPQVPAAPGC